MTTATACRTPDRGDRIPNRLLEGLVALAILVSLAGVVMPEVADEVRGLPEEQAVLDMQRIVSGLRSYSRDTLFLPTGTTGRTDVAWLFGPGEIPGGHPFAQGGEGRPLEEVLLTPAMGGRSWHGPYVDELRPDPWGRAYLVNVDGLVIGNETAMVLSAGPDGVVDTPADARHASGDDLLLPVN